MFGAALFACGGWVWCGRIGSAGGVARPVVLAYNAWLHRKFIAIVDVPGLSWENLGRRGAERGARAASGTVRRDRVGLVLQG